MNNIIIAILLTISQISMAGFFIPDFDESEPYIIIEGRMSFSVEPYWMIDGLDEVALFIGDVCIGSTNRLHPSIYSHYDLLKVNTSYDLNINDLIAKAYNSETGTIWNADITGHSMGSNYYGRDCHIDVSANEDTGTVPEPSTLLLLSAGLLLIKRVIR